jgi:hypothetical protein
LWVTQPLLLVRVHQGDVFPIVFHWLTGFDPSIASLLVEGLLILFLVRFFVVGG